MVFRKMAFIGVLLVSSAFGLGLAGAASADPSVRARPNVAAFGERVLGFEYTGTDLEILSLSGDEDVLVETATIDGPDAADFSFDSSQCENVEVSNQFGCFISINFLPEETGPKTATVTVTTAVGDPIVIPVSGSGVEPATNAPSYAGQTTAPSLAGGQIWGMATGDLNGDGRADALTNVQNMSEFTIDIAVYMSDAQGALETPTGYELSPGGFPNGVTTGFFDENGSLDVVGYQDFGGRVYLNDGAGGLIEGQDLPIETAFGFRSVAVGDYDEDGSADVASVGVDQIQTFLGNGDGTFQDPLFTAYEGAEATSAVAADFSGDGTANDLGFSSYNGYVAMLGSDGDGTFTELDRIGGPGCGCESPESLAASDLTGDGRDDLVAGLRYDNKVATYISLPSGEFERRQTLSLPISDFDPNPYEVAAGDMNGDGHPDVVTADYIGDSVTVLVGNGDGTLSYADRLFPQLPGEYFAPHGIEVDDFNGDGKLDFSTASQAGVLATYINTGTPQPAVEPEAADFGEVVTGTTSDSIVVELSNPEGLAPLEVGNVTLSGAESPEFSFAGDDCLDSTVLVGESCTTEIQFDPVGLGDRSAQLTFSVNTVEGTMTVPLSGTAVAAPDMSVDPSAIDFPDIEVGSTSDPDTVTVTNTGGAPLILGALSASGPNTGSFEADGADCVDQTVAPGEACEISISFAPLEAGPLAAVFTLAGNISGGGISIPVTGTGTAVPVAGISLQPTGINFPDTEVGTESAARSVTVTSTGGVPLILGAVGVTGSGAASLPADVSACAGKTLAPGATCAMSIRFKPTQAGTVSAALGVPSNAPGGPASVALTGTATTKPIPPPPPAPKVTFKQKPKKKYVIRAKKLKKVKVAFKSDQTGSKFQCRLDRRKFSACKSPKVYKNLKPGTHTIRVRAAKAGRPGPVKIVKFKVVRKRK